MYRVYRTYLINGLNYLHLSSVDPFEIRLLRNVSELGNRFFVWEGRKRFAREIRLRQKSFSRIHSSFIILFWSLNASLNVKSFVKGNVKQKRSRETLPNPSTKRGQNVYSSDFRASIRVLHNLRPQPENRRSYIGARKMRRVDRENTNFLTETFSLQSH